MLCRVVSGAIGGLVYLTLYEFSPMGFAWAVGFGLGVLHEVASHAADTVKASTKP